MAKEKNTMKQTADNDRRMHWDTQNEKCEIFNLEEGKRKISV